jgi:hypothetical protein
VVQVQRKSQKSVQRMRAVMTGPCVGRCVVPDLFVMSLNRSLIMQCTDH